MGGTLQTVRRMQIPGTARLWFSLPQGESLNRPPYLVCNAGPTPRIVSASPEIAPEFSAEGFMLV